MLIQQKFFSEVKWKIPIKGGPEQNYAIKYVVTN